MVVVRFEIFIAVVGGHSVEELLSFTLALIDDLIVCILVFIHPIFDFRYYLVLSHDYFLNLR